MQERVFYLTDDRDLPLEQQRSLVIFQGGNGDWYVQVGDHRGRAMDGVRLCTSGGAASAAPGLTAAIADAYRAVRDAGEPEAARQQVLSRQDMEAELQAWRARFPDLRFDELDGLLPV